MHECFTDILDDFNLVQMVTQPTRQDYVLDLFLTTNPALVTDVTILPGLGDHDIVSVETYTNYPEARKIHLFNKADWTTFRSKMKSYQAKFFSNHTDTSVDRLWSDFTENLEQMTDKCIPSKVIKGKPSLPWISHEIKRLIHKRNKFCKAYRRTGNTQLREKYLSLRHQIRRSVKDSHEAYLEGMLGLDGKGNQTSGHVDSMKQGISPLKKNDQLHTDTKDKANILNEQFQSVFTPLSPLSLQELSLLKVQDLADKKVIGPELIPEDMKNPTPVMPDIIISEAGISKLLKNLYPRKAAGTDKIKPAVLQELREELAPILKILFERSLQNGSVPNVWTSANVSPLFKKGDKSSAANYRPTSLTCILCKVMKHTIASNLAKHLDINDLMYDLQHGFMERRSCETQLAYLVEDLARVSSVCLAKENKPT